MALVRAEAFRVSLRNRFQNYRKHRISLYFELPGFSSATTLNPPWPESAWATSKLSAPLSHDLRFKVFLKIFNYKIHTTCSKNIIFSKFFLYGLPMNRRVLDTSPPIGMIPRWSANLWSVLIFEIQSKYNASRNKVRPSSVSATTARAKRLPSREVNIE